MPPKAPAPLGFVALLNRPAFGRLLMAGIASYLGIAIADVCLVWLTFSSTGSALSVGYVGASALLGGITFSLIGGSLADRYDRQHLMVAADLGRAATVGALVVVLALVGFHLPSVLVAVFVLQALSAVFTPAEQSAIPQLVAGPEVAAANAVVRSSRTAVGFVGAAIGGIVLVLLGPTGGVGINAVTFGVSAALLTGMTLPPSAAAPTGPRVSFLEETRQGFAYLRRERALLELTLSATFLNFFNSLVSAFIVVYVTVLVHGSALQFATVVGAELAGGTVGAVLAVRARSEHWAGRAWIWGYGIGGGACAVLLGLVPVFPIVVGLAFALGVLTAFSGTSWLTAAQRYVPTGMQGRYFGIDNLGSIAILPVSLLAGGWLIERYQVGPTYLAAGVLWLAVGLLFAIPRPLREWGSAVDGVPAAPDLPLPSAAGGMERILFPPGSP